MISFVVAMDRNRVIGNNNDLPWHIPNDLKFFKETTLHHTIIMGRKTFESFGKPLPNRRNVIVTSDTTYHAEGCDIIHSVDTIRQWNVSEPETEWMVIGGSVLFEQLLAEVDRMYITFIDEVFSGDTHFPQFDHFAWSLTSEEKGVKNDKNPYDYYFRIYDRV
ncbi:dihydrofolate reductase [Thalassobacillus sp. CUG 92003]|uniref:dihydrofolate reductase n=1 Tax=Thalassobacillus sp. CUG 92003 TaxID=2736641 RepID=UPI0015E71677